MITVEFEALGTGVKTGREIFHYTHKHEGPLLLITAGVHGNEPSGVIALDRVRRYLELMNIPIRGSFIGVCGNLPALSQSKRFIDQDLNRSWGIDEVEEIRSKNEGLNTEQLEITEILGYFDSLNLERFKEKWFIDCHTTSSESIPYFSIGGKPECLAFAGKFPVHSVLGFSNLLPTTMDHYLNRNGFDGFTLEAGQHDELSSVENCEAVIFMALVNSGCIHPGDIDCFGHCRDVLAKVIFDEKRIFDIVYRHSIRSDDGFEMEPGFVNFQKICKGERLAIDRNGPIDSEDEARILMPLYQKQGNDGFFIIQERK
ncbi:MAG TPA: succinylglutamate desuccinylase/aspartoacylase family protein [Cryomorphaceae bacterium]|nr:succinylglutamate desuccinylase/aspartoacylase family protein [Cryomorphaceae bacterium]